MILSRYRLKKVCQLVYNSIALSLSRKSCVLIDTPTHGNLGDHAIVMAEKDLVRNIYKNEISEISAPMISGIEKFYAKLIPKQKTILIPGGGFLGCLWENEEQRFRRILQAFSGHKIIVFPQTITFDTETSKGRQFFSESKGIYESHPNLTIFVREKNSLNFMKTHMPSVRCILVPDIVTILHPDIHKQNRDGVILCMRRDHEKRITDKEYAQIKLSLKERLGIRETDTVISHGITPKERKNYLNQKLTEFAKAKLVITDRLHGMVFAAITGTPCIAVSNSNGKVKGVYEWIRGNKYVRYAENIDELKMHINNLELDREYSYDYSLVEKHFEPLIKELKSI